MMERCQRQHRIGETCGAKLVHPDFIERRSETCRTCQDIDVKKRRYHKLCENIDRWSSEKGRFAASLEKAENERDLLIEKIRELQSQRPIVINRMSSDRSGEPRSSLPTMVPPTRPTLPPGGDSYGWSSQGRGYTTPGQVVGGYDSPSPVMARGSSVPQTNRRAPSLSSYDVTRR